MHPPHVQPCGWRQFFSPLCPLKVLGIRDVHYHFNPLFNPFNQPPHQARPLPLQQLYTAADWRMFFPACVFLWKPNIKIRFHSPAHKCCPISVIHSNPPLHQPPLVSLSVHPWNKHTRLLLSSYLLSPPSDSHLFPKRINKPFTLEMYKIGNNIYWWGIPPDIPPELCEHEIWNCTES